MKKGSFTICFSIFLLLLLSSCLETKQRDVDEWLREDFQLVNFGLKNGVTFPYSSIRFTIDQINGEIFNLDSLPFGTVIEEKVAFGMMYDSPSAVGLVEVYQEMTNETKKWEAKDSLNFNKLVRLDLYKDKKKKKKKSYNIRVNVHQMKPDSMAWTRMKSDLLPEKIVEQQVLRFNDHYWSFIQGANGYKVYQASMQELLTWKPLELSGLTNHSYLLKQMVEFEGSLYLPTEEGVFFTSTDGLNWSQLSDAPNIKTVVGVLKGNIHKKSPATLITVVQEEGSSYFYTMSKEQVWQKGNEVQEGFPVSGFGHISYVVGFEPRLLVVAGRTATGQLSHSSWETMDGRKWIQVEKGSGETLEPLEGVLFTQYDQVLFLVGGFNAQGVPTKSVRRSTDRGATWAVDTSLVILPPDFIAQGDGSVIVDDDHYMLLFSGKAAPGSAVLNELWRGRTNHFGFKKD